LDATDTNYTNLVISNIASANDLTIEFTYPASSTLGYRLDNIKVVGTK